MRAVEDHSGGADDRRIEQPIKGQNSRTSRPPFTAPLVECVQLLGSGHYFGCIALAKVLLEAVIRQVSQIKLMKKPNHDRNFTEDLEALHKKNLSPMI